MQYLRDHHKNFGKTLATDSYLVVYLDKIGRKPRIIKTAENALCIAF